MKQTINKQSPITGGKLELRSEPATVEYRGETIAYEKKYYHCVDSGMEFTDDVLESENLKLIYDTYRRHHSIPLAEELRQMRANYGLPSSAMSLILGLGENQYALYEEGTVPIPSVGRLLALAFNPVNLKSMLQSARSDFTDKQYRKYFKAIMSAMRPAQYEIENVGVMDFGLFEKFPPANCFIGKNVTSSRRSSYNGFLSYATVK